MLAVVSSFNGFAQSSDQVTINLNWYHQFQFAGIYAAKELGYYEDEGLDVIIKEGDGKFDINWVLKGDARYGFALSSQLLNNPKRDSLLIVAIVFQQSHITLATRKKDSIRILADLARKKINVGPELLAMIKSAGVKLDQLDIHGPRAYLDDLENAETYAVPYSVLDLNLDQHQGLNLEDYKLFKPVEYGIAFYGDCLYTSQKELEKNPDRVETMHQATLKGWQYAIDNPDKVIDIIIEKYGWTGSREALEEEAQVVIQSLIIPSLYELGFSDKNKWLHMAKVLSGFDLMPGRDVDFDRLIYTNKAEQNTKSMAQLTKVSATTAGILLILGLGLLGYNQQLRKTVRKHTKDLHETNTYITEKNNKLAEQKADLEKLNSFRARILTILSHDIRAPLHSFGSIVEMVNSGGLDHQQIKQLLMGTGAQVEQVNGFIDSLLYWSRNQAHGISVKMEVCELSALVDKTIHVLDLSAKVKNVNIMNQVNPEYTVSADPNLLSTTIRNLISNAIKFCSSEDNISIHAEAQDEFIRLSVTDTGPGMTPEQVEMCFSKDISTKKGSKDETGFGFGLLMCKEFVELNQGEIGVESTLDQGSTFWFTIKKA
jgi:signal transduction histidine kinase